MQIPILSLLVFSICTTIYWPALRGPFVFDDFAPTNLPALGAYGGVHDWETLKFYLAQAHAGPTGRPVSMLSFLLNATDWPADPFPFKLTNLLLHLLNGALLYAVLTRLLQSRYSLTIARWIALVAATWWLIHPMWVSTVLYVVQRMAMLPVAFLLLGYLAYLHGRFQLLSIRGYVWMTAGVVGGTALATFSKENGALLPLLLLVTEFIWLRPHSRIQPDKRWWLLFLGLPSLAILSYLALQIPNASQSYAIRPFTLAERLLTEARILCEYIWRLIFPRLHGSGLFHDGYVVSKGLFSPSTTLAALAAIAALLGSAWYLRQRFPAYAFAVFFFFAAHLIESTVIPLELYYEHRNYLPALFLFLPMATVIVQLIAARKTAILIPLTLFPLLGFITHSRAQTWKNEYHLLTTWALENPTSVRAQIYGALALQNRNQHREALALLLRAIRHNPTSLSLHLYAFSYECVLGIDATSRLTRIHELLQSRPFDFHDYDMFKNALQNIHNNRCHHIAPTTVYSLLDELETNTTFQRHHSARRMIAHWRGEFLLADGKAQAALEAFHQSQTFLPDLDAGMLQVAMLASARHYSQALALLTLLDHLYSEGKGIKPGMNYAAEIQRIHEQLLDELRKR